MLTLLNEQQNKYLQKNINNSKSNKSKSIKSKKTCRKKVNISSKIDQDQKNFDICPYVIFGQYCISFILEERLAKRLRLHIILIFS